jgi:hypothetical protein
LQIEIQDYHRDQLEKNGISLPAREETVLTISGNFTQKELDKAAKKGTNKQSSRSERIADPTIEKSFDEMLQALAIPKTEIKALSEAQKQTQFDYVKQRIFEQTGEIWKWEGAPKDGKWVRVNKAIAATKKQISYKLNHDGSVILRSLVGTSVKSLKRMSDHELKEIGLFKTLIGKDEKFFPTNESLELRYQEKEIATTDKPKSQAILTRPEAFAIAKNFGFLGTGQNLYDWSKAALTAKSDESRLANREKLANVGLLPVFSPENKPAWQAKTLTQ